MANDVILDTLDTLIALLQKNGGTYLPAHRGEAERIVRAAWGGERPYVGKTGEDGQRSISARDAAIRRDAQRGASTAILCRRYSLGLRRVQQILQIDQPDGASVCLTDCAAPGDASRINQARPRRQGRSAPNESPPSS